MLYPLLLFLLSACLGSAAAQSVVPNQTDALFQRLLAAIRQIQIIDNHAHPALPGDPEMDALTFEPAGLAAMESFPLPLRLRPTNPEYLQALRVLYDYPYTDLSPEHLQELAALKQQKRAALGSAYFNEVLDKVGISISLANRVGMTSAPLDRQRFKWVAFIDAYLFPLNNTVYKKMNADYQVFFSSEEKLLKRYLDQVETGGKPRRFDDYLRFVRESLARLKADGAVAVKFEAAYLRSLRFDDPPQRQARRIYERYLHTTEVPEDEYRDLQDYLCRYLLREATKLGLPVHFHTGVPVGNAASVAGSNPLLLENIFNDPRYRQTTFVLLHGSYPFTREAILLAGKPNVYVDSSDMTVYLPPVDLARIFKEWLTFYAEKILFGTDAVILSDLAGAEETYWLATEGGRQALALALNEMVQEGRCDEAEALRLARLVLHDNAAKLYGLP
ncbi:MAG TPA: amidohydrolase family protein [Candidatus Binatia bacterium]|nr:amidohydrolase family protein [Candidatus Binatia bacterium]